MEPQVCTSSIRPENYRILQQSVYTHAGIVLEGNKEYLFEGRLGPLVKELGLGSINDLCGVLQSGNGSSHSLGQMVAEAMTTNETFFFREPLHYDVIRKVLLPKLRQDRADTKKLRFWSAACSTGQEAYSLAMLLHEQGFQDWNVDILGTDYSPKVVERAKSGQYQQLEVNRGLPAPMMIKHFKRSGIHWELSPTVRKMARFQTGDLRQSMRTFGPFDLVFCRNVMIYFDVETKMKILRQIHGTLFRGGWLLLGGAETSIDLNECFDKQRIEGVTVYVAR
ncbi:MAG TPA: protein-glutamate O-methyltransferase CheR [Edaphobacter sp.]|nr:protein-glutamate O-methyltransferase CheR [Edaphobacter sp.]